jgi:hypothetical protein
MLILDGMEWIGIEYQSWLWINLNRLERRKLVLELLEWIIMDESKFSTNWIGIVMEDVDYGPSGSA